MSHEDDMMKHNTGENTTSQRQQDVAQALRMAHCMRSHGVPNFPDPPNGNGEAQVTVPRGSASSSQLPSALRACRSLRPGGGS